MLEALAYVGFLINLFNLLPVVPLDGGRAMAAMAPLDVVPGLRRDGRTSTSSTPNPILLIITVVAGFSSLPPLGAAPITERDAAPPLPSIARSVPDDPGRSASA